MSETDSLDLKTGRNSVNRSRHLQCVEQINKERSAVMRVLQANAARFRKQYIRYEPKPPSASTEAKNVRMFETHTPGFCYRRNGDIRQAAVSHEADDEIFIENVNELLFYDDEVDVERVVVLHLLSVQYVKREIRFRNVSHTSYAVQRSFSPSTNNSPMKATSTEAYEIRRSILMPVLNCVIQAARETIQTVKSKSKIELKPKNSFLKGSSNTLLPSYLVLPKNKMENQDGLNDLNDPFDDKELISAPTSLVGSCPSPEEAKSIEKNLRLYVHRPIHIMVDTVLDELRALNSDKAREIIKLAKSPPALREMLMKPEVQDFVEYLHGQPFVSRGDLFHLVPAKLVINPDKDSPPQFSLQGHGEDAQIVNAIEITESSQTALKSLISDIKLNIANEERMKEYKQSDDKGLLLSYSLSDVSIRPKVHPSFGKIALTKKDTKPILSSTKEHDDTSEDASQTRVKFRRISKDASLEHNKGVGGFTITSYTGFSPLTPSDITYSILSDLSSSNEDTIASQEDSLLCPKRKPILYSNPNVIARESSPLVIEPPGRREGRREKRSSKLMSQLEMDVLNEMARGKKAPERSDKKVRGERLSRMDSYHKFGQLRSPLAIAAAKEDLKQKFVDQMSPLQRMHIFKKMNAIREAESYLRDEDIPFASYVVPILNKSAITDIANKLSEKDRKQIFSSENEGGLGLPQCYSQGLSGKRPRNESTSRIEKNDTVSAEDTIIDTRLTEVDVSKLKCEIAEKETHKKFLRLMAQPVPS